jgi:dTDP-4-dehydrorhamnose 3,5-epimerase
MWQLADTPLAGLKAITMPRFTDHRGAFVKSYHEPTFLEAGIDFTLRESFFSSSALQVVRGMHFQIPPHDHAKIVFCPHGAILDVALDMRASSPTYGQYFAKELTASGAEALYIPSGFAHGFCSLSEGAITYYLLSSVHHPASDLGILATSFGLAWPAQEPIMSARDLKFPPLDQYMSPFP